MRYLSVCSGIEAATVAWQPLGWRAVAFSEIEKFPAAVLRTHYPHVANLGDMTKIKGADFKGRIDVLVGGTPCQSFSVAGARRGLEDERGNLAIVFVRLADESDPAFVVWENVPGVLSDRGNAFGCFLAALAGADAPILPPGGKWSNAGYVLGPRRSIAWRVLDAQYFGLAQRRRRVFLVACPRDGADPRKILFEFDGLRRDSAPGRKAKTDVAGVLDASFGRSRGSGQNPSAIIPVLTGSRGWQPNHWEGGPHPCLNQSAKSSGGIGMSDQEIFGQQGAGLVPHMYIPEIVSQAMSCKWSKGTSGPAGDEHHNLIVFGRNQGQECAICLPINTQVGLRHQALGERTELGIGNNGDPAYTLQRGHSHGVMTPAMHVRRLTPRECERLQGFPDDYTAISYGGRPAADSPRYKALGNSMAVPVMRWLGERIENRNVNLLGMAMEGLV